MSSSGAGVDVAPGDPGQISQAAAWHQELADAFELHHATITGATSAVLATWNGEAASSYGRLATIVADHFIAAAGDARTVAGSLFHYARELESCQQEGKRALQEAEHWLLEQNKWQTKLNQANGAIAKAQKQISDAQRTLHNPLMGPALPGASSPMQSAAAAELQAGQAALAKAQADQRTAKKELQHAEQEVMRWQAIGRRAWEEAVQAATQATGAVETVNVAPPPLAGWARLDRFNTPPPQHHHGGGGILGFLGGVLHGGENLIKGGADTVGDGISWAWDHPLGVLKAAGVLGLRGAATVISATRPGTILRLGSQVSGETLGFCVGGTGTYTGGRPIGVSGTGSLCYVATPSGQTGLTVTAGAGAGAPQSSLSGSVSPLISNGRTLGDQGKGFAYVGASAGEDQYSAGATVSAGRNANGRLIWDVNPGWTPNVGGPAPVGVHTGRSYTWTFGSFWP